LASLQWNSLTPAPATNASRFELKYIIDEERARACRDFARSFLRPDLHADPSNGYSYPIHSLYLDDPGFLLAKRTIEGHKNPFKLRIRYYDGMADHPVFLEIKRRVSDAILKERAMVHRSAVARLLAGDWPEVHDLVQPGNLKHFHALERFSDLSAQLRARGHVIVSYRREAWVSPENEGIRMTFDRELVATPFRGELAEGDFERGIKPPVGGVVLELKFTQRYPDWMRELVRVFNLRRTSMPKYVECLYSLDELRGLRRGRQALEARG
jgi:hypothetical protein